MHAFQKPERISTNVIDGRLEDDGRLKVPIFLVDDDIFTIDFIFSLLLFL
jgi:hypothetical protein